MFESFIIIKYYEIRMHGMIFLVSDGKTAKLTVDRVMIVRRFAVVVL